jgi:hypothetical protein
MGRLLPTHILPLKVLSTVPDIYGKILYFCFGAYTGHPSKLLRYFRRMSGNRELTVHWRVAKDVNAATPVVHVQRYVLTLSAKSCH